MRSSLIGALTASLVLITPISFADENTATKTISKADQAVIASNVLCQNIPAIDPENPLQAQGIYSRYMDQVSELFGNNAKDIKSSVVGISKDHQMSYKLNSPINIVGISFDTVNIVTLKEQDYHYYQITAAKPLIATDKNLISNIPQDSKLSVSTLNNTLSIKCNVKAPLLQK